MSQSSLIMNLDCKLPLHHHCLIIILTRSNLTFPNPSLFLFPGWRQLTLKSKSLKSPKLILSESVMRCGTAKVDV